MRKGQASSTQRVVLTNVTPAGEKGGQLLTIKLSIAAVSSSFRYMRVWVLRAQHTCRGRGLGHMAVTLIKTHLEELHEVYDIIITQLVFERYWSKLHPFKS